VQTQGSLEQTSLASLLEAMQVERATGTLSVSRGDAKCSLFFLFGHLFHAAGTGGEGEDAILAALSWSDGQFTFDPRAKLPAEETIRMSTAELLAEAERRGGVATGDGKAPAVAEPEAAAVAATAAPSPPFAPQAVMGNPSAPPIAELVPLPSGKAIYEGLKSAFVDFAKLVRTLESDKHTGYVRLDGSDFASVLLIHDGHVLEALHSDSSLHQGLDAFDRLRERMDRGEGLLDVIALSGETVVALAQLLTARPMFTGLLGRFINFDALLEYLAEENVDGSVVVGGGTEMGVILLRKGSVIGAYTQSKRDLQSSAAPVSALAGERTARIEVKTGATSPEGIDVAAALASVS